MSSSFYYRSTRSKLCRVTFSEAVIEGLASDGGLYVPEVWPKLNFKDDKWLGLGYCENCFEVLSPFMPEIPSDQLKKAIRLAYDGKFSMPEIAPLFDMGDSDVLELFHGRTLAFKDMALSLLPHLIQLARQNSFSSVHEIVVLTATSGDTGKAALEGFSDVPGTRIFVFYPTDGVSSMQKRQMATQKGDNVHVYGIKGNFDDAQKAVKEIFSDQELRQFMKSTGRVFSSANSMNIGRLLPQIAYYIYAYFQNVKTGKIEQGENIDVCVPTGNFGNILAAYYAKKMGLPIDRLILASNENNVLTDFFDTGEYNAHRPFKVTKSPSMDILISSNLERLLFDISGEDADRTLDWMKSLSSDGVYRIGETLKSGLGKFYAGMCTDAQSLETIAEVLSSKQYLVDPHTAVAINVYEKFKKEVGSRNRGLIVATASPFKFSQTVGMALNLDINLVEDELQNERLRLKQLTDLSEWELPQSVVEVLESPIRHSQVCDKSEIKQVVMDTLKVEQMENSSGNTNLK